MDKLQELTERLEEYKQHAMNAEKTALEMLRAYPTYHGPISPMEILRRELLRHHTRTLLLSEIQEWIDELKSLRLYQLYSEDDAGNQICEQVRQYMTEREAVEVNMTYEANHERLRWKPVDLLSVQFDEK